jgi:hypothetical protein
MYGQISKGLNAYPTKDRLIDEYGVTQVIEKLFSTESHSRE